MSVLNKFKVMIIERIMSSENLLTQIAYFLTMMNNRDYVIYGRDLAGNIQMIKFSSFYLRTSIFMMKEREY